VSDDWHYPKFLQAAKRLAYPDDDDRLRELRGEVVLDNRGVWTPEQGKAFRIIWLKCVDCKVRA
jgi:hypothetical protein